MSEIGKERTHLGQLVKKCEIKRGHISGNLPVRGVAISARTMVQPRHGRDTRTAERFENNHIINCLVFLRPKRSI